MDGAANKKFFGIASAYTLGVFNDNFFKQAACLIAIAVGKEEYQNLAAALFSLPFVIAAAPAGWCADKFPKRTIIILSKIAEVAAMIIGGIGLYYISWPLIMTMVFIMGLQSTVFSPALNGTIPEIYPKEKVLPVNGILKTTTSIAILFGMLAAGFTLHSHKQDGNVLIDGGLLTASICIMIAFFGVITAIFIPHSKAAKPDAQFPKNIFKKTIDELNLCRKDPPLWRVMKLDTFIWMVAASQVLMVNKLGKNHLGLNELQTSLLIFAQLIGVACGGAVIGKFGRNGRWLKLLMPSLIISGSGAFIAITSVILMMPEHLLLATAFSIIGVWVLGIGGGMFLVPLESYVQSRPSSDRKGAVIATTNAFVFFAIMVFNVILWCLNMNAVTELGIIGAMLFCMAMWIKTKHKDNMEY